MARNRIIPYQPGLKMLARELRKNMTQAEILLWEKIRRKSLGYEFHRKVPVDMYIVDFYCHELFLAIEIDGNTQHSNDPQACDCTRQECLESLGLRFVRFDDSMIKREINEVIRQIANAIKSIECRKD